METKKKITAKSVITTILFVLFIILLGTIAVTGRLLFESLKWLRDAWGDVSFTTAVFQMQTPMIGVDSNIVNEYVEAAVVPTILLCGIPLVINLVIALLIRHFHFFIPVSGRKKERKLTYRFFMAYGALLVILASWIDVPAVAEDTGMDDYIANSLKGGSSFYQDYYVYPEKVSLTFPEKKRNLVMIYMESMETTYASTDVGGGKPENYIPNLTQLAFDNAFFSDSAELGGCTQTFGSSWTIAAMLASTSGVPYVIPVEDNSMINYTSFLPGLTALGDILEENGYSNYFCCGSDARFGGRRLYLTDHGDYHFCDFLFALDNGYVPEDYSYGWGMEDKKVFMMAKAELSRAAASDEPFNFTILTADTHFPDGITCEDCDYSMEENQYGMCISCSDRHVAAFVHWMQKQDWYENTTVVLIGDHLSMNETFWDDLPAGYERHMYDCFLNLPAGLNERHMKSRQFSNEDYFPTILAAMGVQIEGERLGLGTNLFSEEETVLEEVGSDRYNDELATNMTYITAHFD